MAFLLVSFASVKICIRYNYSLSSENFAFTLFFSFHFSKKFFIFHYAQCCVLHIVNHIFSGLNTTFRRSRLKRLVSESSKNTGCFSNHRRDEENLTTITRFKLSSRFISFSLKTPFGNFFLGF